MKYIPLILFGLFELYVATTGWEPPRLSLVETSTGYHWITPEQAQAEIDRRKALKEPRPVADFPLMWEDESISYFDAMWFYRTAYNFSKLPQHPSHNKEGLYIWDLFSPESSLMWEDESIDYYHCKRLFRTG